MNNLYFWNSWNKPYKQIYISLLSVFLLSLVAMGVSCYLGIEGVVSWDVETDLEPVKVVIDQFPRNLFNFTVESESYYALDKFIASDIHVNLTYAYVYLFLVIAGVVFILTTFTYLDLYWYMASVLAFLFFMFSLKLELLGIAGRSDRIPMLVVFLLYSGLSYSFNAYFKSASYGTRLISFIALTVVVATVIGVFSEVEKPFLYLANFGSVFPVVIMVLFTMLTGHDIIKGFLYIVSGTNNGSKNALLNFIFASLLYLVNILLLLLKKLYILQLDIIYVNPFLLFSISAVLGIWMYRKRTEMFSGVLPFAPAGAFVYISLAIISTAGMSYALINGNIGMTDAYERIIIYGHLFFGMVFLVYVLANFIMLFDQKISIYDVVYKPQRMTFLAVPAIAITVSSFFFLYQKKYPYHLMLSGYYSYAGDVLVKEKNYPLALQYYRNAVLYDHPNHRANYSIASLVHYLDDRRTAIGYYENAIVRDPSVQAYIGISNAYLETGDIFNALFKVQEGLEKFPGDGRLYNNLGVIFYKSNLADSSIHYLLKSKDALEQNQVAVSNVMYLLANKQLFDVADSIAATSVPKNHISYFNNRLAIKNQLGEKDDIKFRKELIKDTVLNASTYAYLVNSNLNSISDTSRILTGKMESLQIVSNQAYQEDLTFQLALKKYYTGRRWAAQQDLIILNNNTSVSTRYAAMLGYWMFEQQQYDDAAEYFRTALKNPDPNTQLNYCLASLEAGIRDEQLIGILTQLKDAPDENIAKVASNLLAILQAGVSVEKALVLEEPVRLQYLYFNRNRLSVADLDRLYNSFTNGQVKIFAGAALCVAMLENDELKLAAHYYQAADAVANPNQFAQGEKNYALMRLLAASGDGRHLQEKATSSYLNSDKEKTRSYFRAKAYELSGDTANASIFYLKVLEEIPFLENAFTDAVRYLSKHSNEKTAYNYIVEVIQYNPSPLMKKTYFNLCLDMGLLSYAESVLNELQTEIPMQEYMQYKKRLDEKVENN